MPNQVEKHLQDIDQDRRDAVIKLVRGAAFAVPVVASFALDGRMNIASAGNNTTASGANPA